MSIPDIDSTYCRKKDCGTYNVNGYCEYHLVNFFDWLKKEKLNLTYEYFEDLWNQFEKANA